MLPISRNQLDKLGDRLRDSEVPVDDDLELLQQVLAAYDEVLQAVRQRLTGLRLKPTVRLKTTGTLVDKLRRDRTSSLKTVHDLAGARVVVQGTINDQNAVRDRIVQHFSKDAAKIVVVDRREDPRAGYRAIHVVVRLEAVPVEIQIRTALQDSWAQVFERLADQWGRGIRYGEDPDRVSEEPAAADRRKEIVALMMKLSENIADLEEQQAEFPTWPPDSEEPPEDAPPQAWAAYDAANRYIGSLVALETAMMSVLGKIDQSIKQEVDRG